MRNDNILSNGFEANAAQIKAIRHNTGPAMVLAGPGSGKTKVIVERIRYLIEEIKCDPSSILVITFTKAAAIEMQYRFLRITDSSYPEVSFGTFHSVFYQIIRNSLLGKTSPPEIVSENFKYEMIKDILMSLKQNGAFKEYEYEDILEEIPEMISEISRVKNLAISPDKCREGLKVRAEFGEIFNRYNKMLSDFNKIDFDDMLLRCYDILQNNFNLLYFWRNKFRYILIDEYQDINPMQYKVIKLLLGDECNLFAVGDDDQSIYGFRGSDPGIMLDFAEDFKEKNPVVINLNINYRCGRIILQNALKLIEVNTIRYKKELRVGEKNGEGKLYARRYESRNRQNEVIATFLKNTKCPLGNIAILFRTNSEARILAKVLSAYDINTNLSEDAGSIYDDMAVKLSISYISFACDGQKRSDYLKIINKPMRYIARDSASKEVVSKRDVMNFYLGNSRRLKSVEKFFREIDMLSHLRPALCVRYIRKSIGIDKLFEKSGPVLDEFEKLSGKFVSNKDFLKYIEQEMTKEAEKVKNNKKRSSDDCVKLMTMHGAKGLEFDMVWIPDLNEGIIPSRSAVLDMQIQEERRMLYVAMTRAKKALILSYVTGNRENPMLPTRFLRPIRYLWEEADKNYQTSSEPSSGISISSSNSTSSR